MLATLRTIRWSISSDWTNAARSAAMRSTASPEVRAGVRSPQSPIFEIAEPAPSFVPGRTRAEVEARSSRRASISSGSNTPEFLRNSSALSRNEPSRMSWPPITKSAGAGRLRPSKRGRAVTNPVVSRRPLAIAKRPRAIVVPTPPKAPINQSPTRRGGGVAGMFRALGAGVCGWAGGVFTTFIMDRPRGAFNPAVALRRPGAPFSAPLPRKAESRPLTMPSRSRAEAGVAREIHVPRVAHTVFRPRGPGGDFDHPGLHADRGRIAVSGEKHRVMKNPENPPGLLLTGIRLFR